MDESMRIGNRVGHVDTLNPTTILDYISDYQIPATI